MKKYSLNITAVNIIVAVLLLFAAGFFGYHIHQPETVTEIETVEWVRKTPYVHLNTYPLKDSEYVEDEKFQVHVVTVFYEFYDLESAQEFAEKVNSK